MRAAAALRHGSRRRNVPHGDVPARRRAGTVERRLRATVAPPQGRPLRRQSEPAAALLSVSGRAQALACEHPGALPRFAEGPGHQPARARYPLRRGRLGVATLGAWGLGWEVWLDGMEVT